MNIKAAAANVSGRLSRGRNTSGRGLNVRVVFISRPRFYDALHCERVCDRQQFRVGDTYVCLIHDFDNHVSERVHKQARSLGIAHYFCIVLSDEPPFRVVLLCQLVALRFGRWLYASPCPFLCAFVTHIKIAFEVLHNTARELGVAAFGVES